MAWVRKVMGGGGEAEAGSGGREETIAVTKVREWYYDKRAYFIPFKTPF